MSGGMANAMLVVRRGEAIAVTNLDHGRMNERAAGTRGLSQCQLLEWLLCCVAVC